MPGEVTSMADSERGWQQVGRIEGIHRYAVKSMAGETLSETQISRLGVVGDRAYAVRDEVRGGIRGAKKLPGLMALRARYVEPASDGSSLAEIEFPDGSRVRTSDPDAGRRISGALDHEVSLWPRLPADQREHYRRGAPTHSDVDTELREMFARTKDEPLPDLRVFPRELIEFESPPGTYFDAFPLLLMSSAGMRSLASRAPSSSFDVARFRPNLVIGDTPSDGNGIPEFDWVGRRLRIGPVRLEIAMECPRCVMTTHGFGRLPKDPKIMRTLVRETGGNLGVYARVEECGTVRVGDVVELEASAPTTSVAAGSAE